MRVADNLRKICSAARPAIEAALDAAEELSEIREAASEQGLDWSQVKALLKAHIQDERDGGGRFHKLLTKADNAATYAAMIDLGPLNMAEKRKITPQSKTPRPKLPTAKEVRGILRAFDAASPESESAAPSTDGPSLGGGNLAGEPVTAPGSLSETDVNRRPTTAHELGCIVDTAPSPAATRVVSTLSDIQMTTGADPLDIRSMPFYRGAAS